MIKKSNKAVVAAALAEKLKAFIGWQIAARAVKLKFNSAEKAFKITNMLIIKCGIILICFKRSFCPFKAVCIRRRLIINKSRGKRHKKSYLLLLLYENAAVIKLCIADNLCNARKLHSLSAIANGIINIVINRITNFRGTPL